MWIADQNKEQFLDMLQLESVSPEVVRTAHIGDVEGGLQRGLIRLIWDRRPEDGILPAIIVIPEDDRREFFAWSNTYLGAWCPISGLFRVVTDHGLKSLLGERSNHVVIPEYRNAALGMIFGEAGTAWTKEDSQQSGSLFANCVATCSFAMGRAMYLGHRDLAMVARNWHRAQVAARKRSFDRDMRVYLGPWSVLLEVGGLSTSAQCGTRSVSESVVAICHSLHKRDEIDGAALQELTRGWPELEEAFRRMNDARERRVEALEFAFESVGERPRESSQSTIIALGLLASRIAPGTLDHARLLSSYLTSMRGLMLWYGLFSGVTRSARLVDHYDGLGRRILRNMLSEDTIFSSPSCDIAIDELEIISSSEPLLGTVPRATAGRLVVEILPCVNTMTPWLTSEPPEVLTQLGLFDSETRRLESDVRELTYAAERLLRTLRNLGTG